MSFENSPIQIYTDQPKMRKPLGLKLLLSLLPLVTFVSVIVLAFLPLPYVIQSPGPTVNVLESYDGEALIELSDPKAKNDTVGELRMVTVSAKGTPENKIRAYEYIYASLQPGYNLVPLEEYYPNDITAEELAEYNLKAMVSSQSTAAAAAYNYLGVKVPATVTILGTVKDSPLEGKVKEGDILKAVEINGKRTEIDTAAITFELTRDLPVDTPLVFEIERDGKIERFDTHSYRPAQLSKFDTGSRFGIYLRVDPQLPEDVKIHLEDIGGPSAGMIFSLAIIDKLTGGDLVGENIVAGTGAISYDGIVEPIGGIVQKMHGAKRDNAKWFLAPIQNCDEVVGNIPDGLNVWPVHTLDDALDALDSIKSGQTAHHPTCDTFLDK
ncbi:Lon protease (S16) C-terminal proteolytic domain protein [Gleimia coleocanis DSM 15436]|uniref:endopeptidase La n=1 Tax=Gleimia coleocanis DSM 15436 TaxID=525245 RepID=C0W0T8_9ACTO|nr:S16 family serine protease [Gleimia coleocanis]EEH63662.1 Lon protease (S16) C-terminal proteolytic domain protein [Gleimia coleocanis DSM 15436]